jgi:hypothetical protein
VQDFSSACGVQALNRFSERYTVQLRPPQFSFANRLSFLAGFLPQGASLSVDRLIDQHSILPFFGAFLPPERELPEPSEFRS